MKSALILIGMMAFASASYASTLTISCQSQNVQVSGTLQVDDSGNASGTLLTTITSANSENSSGTAFTGTYSVYPAGSFCYDTAMKNLTITGQTSLGATVTIRSVRGADCTGGNGDMIYVVSRTASPATCTLTEN
jgi:hypothetical protein